MTTGCSPRHPGLLTPWGAPHTVGCLAPSLTSAHQCQHHLQSCHSNPVSPNVTWVRWGACSPPLRTTALPPVFQPASFRLAPEPHPRPPDRAFPQQRQLRARHVAGLSPSCSLAVLAPEGAGRLSCLYSANKEASCSHQGGPLGWGELLRTLFLNTAPWGCLSAHQQCFAPLSPGEGPPVTRGMARGLRLGMPLPHAIVGGQETRWVFRFGNKTWAWDSIESKFPSLTLCRGPGDFDVGGRGLGWPRAWWSEGEGGERRWAGQCPCAPRLPGRTPEEGTAPDHHLGYLD